MEQVCIRFEGEFLRAIEKIMRKQRYSTLTEFIRESVRDKLKQLEKEESLARIRRLYGYSKKKTDDFALHRAGENAFKQLEKKFK